MCAKLDFKQSDFLLAKDPKSDSRGVSKSSLFHQVEDTTDVQVQHLLTRPVWCRLQRSSPRRARIGNEDIEFILCLLDLRQQLLDAFVLADVGWNRDRAALDPGEFVEFLDGLVEALRSFCLACGYDDFSCASA